MSLLIKALSSVSLDQAADKMWFISHFKYTTCLLFYNAAFSNQVLVVVIYITLIWTRKLICLFNQIFAYFLFTLYLNCSFSLFLFTIKNRTFAKSCQQSSLFILLA